METTFNFSNKGTEFIYALHPKSEIILRIKRKNNSIATLYFTNQLNENIKIPSEFIVYQDTEILNPNNYTDDYTLYWRNKYDIVYRGETLFNFVKEKTWTIYS